MADHTRVGLLGLALLLLSSWAPSAAGQKDPCGADCAFTFAKANFRACMRSITSIKARPETKLVVFPEDGAAYDTARKVFNSRFDPMPAAVFYAYDANDVSAAVKCAYKWGVQVSPASGRQSYQGWTVMDGYLVVDVSNIKQTRVSINDRSIFVGPGATGMMVQSALYDHGKIGIVIPTATNPFVGMAGWTLAGGYGYLGRYMGLGCDNLASLEIVVADGTIITSTPATNKDLFWSACGGGGGTMGIVTKFEFKISTLPEEGRVTEINIAYVMGVESTVLAFMALQRALPGMDRRFGLTYRLEKGRLTLQGVFLGQAAEAFGLLKSMGMLELLDPTTPSNPNNPPEAIAYPYGLSLQPQPNFYTLTLLQSVNWASLGGFPTPWGEPTNFTYTQENLDYLTNMARGRPGYQVVGGSQYSMVLLNQPRQVKFLKEKGIEALAEFSIKTLDNCTAEGGLAASCYFTLEGQVLGGAYQDRVSAFGNREANLLMDGYVGMVNPLKDFIGGLESDLGMAFMEGAVYWVNDYLRTLKPYLGDTEFGSLNYLAPAFDQFQRGYFGDNYRRLQRIKQKWDPIGLFDKPYTVQGKARSVPKSS